MSSEENSYFMVLNYINKIQNSFHFLVKTILKWMKPSWIRPYSLYIYLKWFDRLSVLNFKMCLPVCFKEFDDVWMLEHVTYGGLALQVVQAEPWGGRELGHVHDLDGEFLHRLSVHAAAHETERTFAFNGNEELIFYVMSQEYFYTYAQPEFAVN